MPSLDEIARSRTALPPDDIAWLHAVVTDWQIIADLAFADLVLWVPDAEEKGHWAAARRVRRSRGTGRWNSWPSDNSPPGGAPIGQRCGAVRRRHQLPRRRRGLLLPRPGGPDGRPDRPAPPEGRGMVTLYIEVDDVPEYVEQATTRGASVVMPYQKLPIGGAHREILSACHWLPGRSIWTPSRHVDFDSGTGCFINRFAT